MSPTLLCVMLCLLRAGELCVVLENSAIAFRILAPNLSYPHKAHAISYLPYASFSNRPNRCWDHPDTEILDHTDRKKDGPGVLSEYGPLLDVLVPTRCRTGI